MNKKSYLSRVRLPRTPAEWLEAVMNFIFFLCGMLAVGCVVLISVYMVISGVPAIHKIGLFRFLLGTEWASTAADPKFGILPFILSSVYGTLGATLIGVPIGLLTAVFLSKAADPKLRTVVVLRFYEDMPLGDIARVTSTNLNTVKSRLYKALAELRRDMAGETQTAGKV